MPAYAPSDVFGPNYSVNTTANTITFTYSNAAPNEAFDMPEITDTLAAATVAGGGDVRTILYGILEKVAEWYEGLPTNDRPEFMRVSRSGSVSDIGGNTYINRNYIFTFRAAAGTMALLPES